MNVLDRSLACTRSNQRVCVGTFFAFHQTNTADLRWGFARLDKRHRRTGASTRQFRHVVAALRHERLHPELEAAELDDVTYGEAAQRLSQIPDDQPRGLCPGSLGNPHDEVACLVPETAQVIRLPGLSHGDRP